MIGVSAFGDGGRTEIVARSRYLDRWSRRDGRWAIDHRVHVADTQTFTPLPADAQAPPQGRRDATDPSFTLGGETWRTPETP